MADIPFPAHSAQLRLRRLGIDTYQEPVLYMHRDCPVCHSEGFEAQSRVELSFNGHSVIATLNVVHGDFLAPDQALVRAWGERLRGSGACRRCASARATYRS